MDPLQALLARKLAEGAPAPLCVALSGGGDSTALLHALAQLPQARERGLRALHVDHGLHVDSAKWAEHCRRSCTDLRVPMRVIRVLVGRDGGESLEAAARHARYAALALALQHGEWLALAHHRDDQTETVLLKLLRGAGPEGLGGMRERRAFARGTLWRPLLELPRSSLRAYLEEHRLDFIDDPSNADTSRSRNFLRREIVPRLLSHWPQAAESITHSAALNREAAAVLDAAADEWLARWRKPDGTLDAHGWRVLPHALRVTVMEHWLHDSGFDAPPPARCEELRRQIADARKDRTPCIAWPGGELHLWRGTLHAMAPRQEIAPLWEMPWNGTWLELPGNAGVLMLREAATGAPARLASPLRVCFRRGGERIKPAGDAHTRELRDLLQRADIPPWQRGRIPLVFDGDQLIAVGDLWINDAGKALFDGIAAELAWQRGNPLSCRPIDSPRALR